MDARSCTDGAAPAPASALPLARIAEPSTDRQWRRWPSRAAAGECSGAIPEGLWDQRCGTAGDAGRRGGGDSWSADVPCRTGCGTK